MRARWLSGALLAAAMIACVALLVPMQPAAENDARKEPPVPDASAMPLATMTAAETKQTSPAFTLVRDMRVGWNLGNALDSIDFRKKGIRSRLNATTPEAYYETLWGNPVTTPGVIRSIAEAGFGTVRVPVTYYDHMDSNLQIRKAWLDRVETVVGYVLENDMYCVIDLHHDAGQGSWLQADPSALEAQQENLATVWKQIALRFRDYDHRLLFEGFNEIMDVKKNWTNSTSSAYNAVNQLNQTFVDTVRDTGGNNASRFLIVNPYAASADEKTIRSFRLPEDRVEHRLIASVHTYAPAAFTWTADKATWTNTYKTWNQRKGEAEIQAVLEVLKRHLIDQGIPVIIGEFGAWNKNNTSERVKYADYFVRAAGEKQITCFWWDDGGRFSSAEKVNSAALIDRYNNRWFFPEIAEALVRAADSRP